MPVSLDIALSALAAYSDEQESHLKCSGHIQACIFSRSLPRILTSSNCGTESGSLRACPLHCSSWALGQRLVHPTNSCYRSSSVPGGRGVTGMLSASVAGTRAQHQAIFHRLRLSVPLRPVRPPAVSHLVDGRNHFYPPSSVLLRPGIAVHLARGRVGRKATLLDSRVPRLCQGDHREHTQQKHLLLADLPLSQRIQNKSRTGGPRSAYSQARFRALASCLSECLGPRYVAIKPLFSAPSEMPCLLMRR